MRENIFIQASAPGLNSGKHLTGLARFACLILAALLLAACGDGGSSGGSTSTPAVPSGLDWSVDGGVISLDWHNSSNAHNYTLSRNGTNSIEAIVITDSNYTDRETRINNAYEYQINACNDLGCSANASLTVNYFAPPAPIGLSATINSDSISLMWDDVSGAEFYNISRTGLEAGATGSSYIDSAVILGNQYSYEVVACNRVGCSTATILMVDYLAPPAPSGLDWSLVNGEISLVWDDVDRATNYTIRRDGAVSFATVMDNTYIDSDVMINNTYEYQINACDALGCSSDAILVVHYYDVLIVSNSFNLASNNSLMLEGAYSVAVAAVNGSSYLFVASDVGDSVSVFSVAADGDLANVANVVDNSNYELDGARSLAVAAVNGSSYLFVAGFMDNGVSVFRVAADGSLANVDNVDDTGNPDYELGGAFSVAVSEVEDSSYLFVAGYNDDGVSVFRIAADGSLTNVDNVADNDILHLNAAISVTVAEVGDSSYMFVASQMDTIAGTSDVFNGISIFRVAADGSLTHVTDVEDDNTLELLSSRAVAVGKANGKSYLFVAGSLDDGVSVFNVADDGSVDNVDNVAKTDSFAYELDGAAALAFAEVGDSSYLFVAGQVDDGVSVFRVTNDGRLANVANVVDNGNYELDGAISLTVAEVGGSSYLFVAGKDDNGVSVFKLTHPQ
ncbi:MAG: beta-propeller fold lactonase family protein [Gammaproteobacteria bacterium]|nr:beta-propeller fold lactonase family protein [Gammaproteobacteria bacterium]